MISVPKANLKKYRGYMAIVIFMLLDYFSIVLAEHSALAARNALDTWAHNIYMVSDAYIYGWVPLLFLLFLAQSGAYRQMRPIVDTVRDIFYGILYGLMGSVILIYFLKASAAASRLFMILFAVFVLVYVYLFRYAFLKFMRKCELFYEPVILIGAGKTAECVLRFFDGDVGYRYQVVGIIDDEPVSKSVSRSFLLYGGFDEATAIVKDSGVQTVIITAPGLAKERLQEMIQSVQPYVRRLSFVPDLIGTPMSSADMDILFGEKILMLNIRNNLASSRNRFIKRMFDLICTVGGGLAISPLLLALTLIVAIDSRGHAIFAHQRIGKNGRMFPCYKFQTMVPHAQEKLEAYLKENPAAQKEWDESFKLTDDPRVTRLGSFLRRTSLDELPQLWNVLRGDMSLVGPRPIVAEEIEKYGDNIREYYMVLPGITGMWQVSGRSDTTYEERVAMDTWYVRNWSIWVDLMYLFKTVKAVVMAKGAY